MKRITVQTLYDEKKKDLNLEILSGEQIMDKRDITTYDIFRPGLALAGYTGYFLGDRIAIIGKTEVSFLKTLTRGVKDKRIATVMKLIEPCVIVAKGLALDKKFISEADRRKIPVLRTKMSTTPFIHKLSTYLDYKLAPTKYQQGTLVDIYGVGVLFIGKPGTGKSECAMDLIERGHRFVADDLVKIVRRGDVLVGGGAEKSARLRHHIEIKKALLSEYLSGISDAETLARQYGEVLLTSLQIAKKSIMAPPGPETMVEAFVAAQREKYFPSKPS